MIITIIEGLIALPKIGIMISSVIAEIVGWWIQRQKKETLALIIDAAAKTAHAETAEERFHAAELWQSVIQRSRQS